MALQKPYGISINGTAINATVDNTISWLISGDVQTAYQVDFYKNEDNSLVFSTGKITSYNLSYKLTAATLSNGNEYKVTVTAYNSLNESQLSDAVIFQTSGRPVITVDTIGTVTNFSNQFSATYAQSESVPLQSWNVNLYNSDKELIDHSDIMTELPMEYLFSNLETETTYYIEFQATSEIGLIGTSGLVEFDVLYLRPKQNVTIETKNIENAGIEISWFVSQILGKSTGTISFVDNEEVSVLTNGSKVYFDNGFSIERDFSLKVWLHSIKNNVTLLKLQGDNGQLEVKYNPVLGGFVLTKTTVIGDERIEDNNTMTYTFVSPYQLNATTGNKAVLLIQQIGNEINLETTLYD